jgi:DNA invertase Pin-like site-specific DNA recombinase
MERAFGYCREFSTRGEAECISNQSVVVAAFCSTRGLQLAEMFSDTREAGRWPWLSRQAGRRLAELVGPGDHVVVARGEAIATPVAALAGYILDWQKRGITLHILASSGAPSHRFGPISTDGEAGALATVALQIAASSARSNRGEAISAGIAFRRYQGLRHTRHAPYGWRWAGRRGSERLAVDDHEWATIRLIIGWRDAGLSWHACAAGLLRNGILTRAGNEWSSSRVRRAYRACTSDRPELTSASVD